MSNIGRKIRDSYCAGFFGGREYDNCDAEIIGEGDEWLVIRKKNGLIAFTHFQTWTNYGRDLENCNLRIRADKQELIDSWCY